MLARTFKSIYFKDGPPSPFTFFFFFFFFFPSCVNHSGKPQNVCNETKQIHNSLSFRIGLCNCYSRSPMLIYTHRLFFCKHLARCNCFGSLLLGLIQIMIEHPSSESTAQYGCKCRCGFSISAIGGRRRCVQMSQFCQRLGTKQGVSGRTSGNQARI